MESVKLDHFVAYKLNDGTERSRVGPLDLEKGTITSVSYPSGRPISDLYQVIELDESVIAGGEHFILTDDVHILPPLSGRDVLAVGKNYAEHAKGCTALAGSQNFVFDRDFYKSRGRVLVIVGDEDKIAMPEEAVKEMIEGGEAVVLKGVGHWHAFEDPEGVTKAVSDLFWI